MPVSKKRKKDGKAVKRATPAAEHEGGVHLEAHATHPHEKAGKPKNPFVAQKPTARSAQRGR